MNSKKPNFNGIVTTANEVFSYEDSCLLALLVYKRFGRDEAASTEAWRRLFGVDVDPDEFMMLVSNCDEIV